VRGAKKGEGNFARKKDGLRKGKGKKEGGTGAAIQHPSHGRSNWETQMLPEGGKHVFIPSLVMRKVKGGDMTKGRKN